MATDFRRGPATAQPVAPFLDRSLGILVLGGTLILLNFFTSAGSGVGAALFHGTTPSVSQRLDPAALKSLGLQSIMLLALFVLAKLDEDAGSFGLTFVLVLWALWIYNTFLKGSGALPHLKIPPLTPPHVA